MRPLPAPGGVFRLAGGLASAVWGITTALGSGASDVAEIVGMQLTSPQRVLLAGVLFGGFVLWDNALLRRRLNDDSDSPFLGWTNPQIQVNRDGSLWLKIDCENSGPSESVAVLKAGDAWWDKGDLAIPVQEWSRINSSKLGQMAYRWTIHVTSAPQSPPPTGTIETNWRLFYFDSDHPDRWYITHASIRVSLQPPGIASVVTQRWLDASSTRAVRRERYRRYFKEATEAAKRGATQAAA